MSLSNQSIVNQNYIENKDVVSTVNFHVQSTVFWERSIGQTATRFVLSEMISKNIEKITFWILYSCDSMTYIKMTIMVGTFCVRNIHIILHILILSCLPFVFLLLFFLQAFSRAHRIGQSNKVCVRISNVQFHSPRFWLLISVM